jgi:hypothetical protein
MDLTAIVKRGPRPLEKVLRFYIGPMLILRKILKEFPRQSVWVLHP